MGEGKLQEQAGLVEQHHRHIVHYKGMIIVRTREKSRIEIDQMSAGIIIKSKKRGRKQKRCVQ